MFIYFLVEYFRELSWGWRSGGGRKFYLVRGNLMGPLGWFTRSKINRRSFTFLKHVSWKPLPSVAWMAHRATERPSERFSISGRYATTGCIGRKIFANFREKYLKFFRDLEFLMSCDSEFNRMKFKNMYLYRIEVFQNHF